MVKTVLLAACGMLLVCATAAHAQVTTIDNFESYADSTALRAAWAAIAPLASSSVTLNPAGITGKSMSIAYDVSTGTNSVQFTFGADQNYSLKTTIRVVYAVSSGSANEDVVIELRDALDNVLVTGVAPAGTGVSQTAWETNLVPFVSSLTAVRKIRLSIRDRGDATGTGTVLFDDISVSSGTYSTCRSCHGDFVGKPYVSLSDGKTWVPDLHDVHRNTMLNFDCATCHTGGTFFPVFIGSSNGGTGFPAIGCLGCHGREQDKGHDSISSGRAAGLNQHHHRAGVTECAVCHTDANPGSYTPVGENVLPAYYFTPDPSHPNKPTDPCSATENVASFVKGLDNDGDLLYEANDPDCLTTPVPTVKIVWLMAALGILLAFGVRRLRVGRAVAGSHARMRARP